jgi:hypothetical protein
MNVSTGRATRSAFTATSDTSAGETKGYAAEELVAELGSAFLCADLGLTREPRADHASYIETWLRVLKKAWELRPRRRGIPVTLPLARPLVVDMARLALNSRKWEGKQHDRTCREDRRGLCG